MKPTLFLVLFGCGALGASVFAGTHAKAITVTSGGDSLSFRA